MKEALKLALEALEHLQPTALTSFYTIGDRDKAMTAIKEALAQPEQEQKPVAFVKGCNRGQWEIFPAEAHQIFGIEQPLYTTPPKRPWGGLTDEFCITNMFDMGHYSLQIVFKSRKNADEFKASLKEKNT